MVLVSLEGSRAWFITAVRTCVGMEQVGSHRLGCGVRLLEESRSHMPSQIIAQGDTAHNSMLTDRYRE